MNLLKKDFQKGFVTVRVNTNDDLWYLEGIIDVGDLIKAKTPRSLFIQREERRVKIGKKLMTLTIQVEKIEFKKQMNSLRLTGKIQEGPEDVQIGSYHTIEVRVGSILTIYKREWKKYQIEKLKRAQVKIPTVLLVVVDTEQSTFALLIRDRINILSELKNPHSIQEEKHIEFYKKVASEIEKLSKETEKIILAGPGFAKEHVKEIIKSKFPELDKKIVLDSTSSATRSGINEILKRGTLDRIIKESELVKESKLIQDFFTHLKKDDGLAVYGLEEVKKADDFGAIKTLLISDENIRKEEISKLAESVEKKNGQIEIISSTHELGEQFNRMSGIGAILRFRIS